MNTKQKYLNKLIAQNAIAYGVNGYIEQRNVKVVDRGDTISINRCEYLKHELEVSDNKITHRKIGWEVIF